VIELDDRRRLRGERGSSLVAAVTLMFAFTAGAVIWLARDADRNLSNRSAAQSIAFQAARTGAQQLDVAALRRGEVAIDQGVATSAARSAATRLFTAYGVSGEVVTISFGATRPTITVTVRITDTGDPVTGVGTVEATDRP
jgi:hypothetical protein